MADNIVSGLFGIDPQQLMQRRQAADTIDAYKFAQLDPMERAQFSIARGAAGLGRAVGGLLGGDAELEKVSAIKQLASQFDYSTPQGMRDFARALQPIAPNEAMIAAKRADEMETSSLGRQKTQADLAKAELNATNEEKLRSELAAAVARGAGNKEIISIVSKYGSADKILQELSRSEDRAERRAAAAGGENGLGKLTTAQKAVDTKFAKEYTDYFAGGGINSLEKNVEELNRAIKIIEQSKEGDTSGKIIGLADKTGGLSYVSQTAADVKDLIGGVAQSNLRQILGGQFAAKEGEALLQRQYDTAQTKDNNLRRLKALYKQASDTVADKKLAAEYYEQFGTLKGFKGTGSSVKKEDTPTASNKKTRTLKSGLVVTIED